MTTSQAPISIGYVALVVKNLDLMIGFYEEVIGLNIISRDGETASLGADTTPLIELRQDKFARHRPNEAGLFHTAFLLPGRNNLGSWLHHAVDQGIRLDGASDHHVSEALYITDPERNGIEVYNDRPCEDWAWHGDEIRLDSHPLDIDELLNSTNADWSGVPSDTRIGHVHLQVGDIGIADGFISNSLGMKRTFGLPTAGWYGSGGYHHHLAANVWNSKGAQRRTPGTTGLAEVGLLASPDALPAGILVDPWGTQFNIIATQAQAA